MLLTILDREIQVEASENIHGCWECEEIWRQIHGIIVITLWPKYKNKVIQPISLIQKILIVVHKWNPESSMTKKMYQILCVNVLQLVLSINFVYLPCVVLTAHRMTSLWVALWLYPSNITLCLVNIWQTVSADRWRAAGTSFDNTDSVFIDIKAAILVLVGNLCFI